MRPSADGARLKMGFRFRSERAGIAGRDFERSEVEKRARMPFINVSSTAASIRHVFATKAVIPGAPISSPNVAVCGARLISVLFLKNPR